MKWPFLTVNHEYAVLAVGGNVELFDPELGSGLAKLIREGYDMRLARIVFFLTLRVLSCTHARTVCKYPEKRRPYQSIRLQVLSDLW